MKLLRSAAELVAWRAALPPGRRVAMVPTMGALHDGHVSLLREGRRRIGDGELVLTLFVNPTQFGPGEDFDRYPRDELGDLRTAATSEVDAVFCPTAPSELFPHEARTWVAVDGLSEVLCGRSRPGHFRGVCTVVAKLWGLGRPDVSVFGEKDWQQLTILRRMHADLHLSGEIVGAPIVREADGLAMSSRNRNLAPADREQALAIPRLLAQVRARFAAGERSTGELLASATESLAPGEVDYVEIRDAADLSAIEVVERPAVCAVAVCFGGVRLIDNTILGRGPT